MKQHVYSRLALLTAICFLAIACDEAPTSTTREGGTPSFGKGNGKGGGKPKGDPPITVTFSDGAQDNISSDGRGPYVDGDCNVDATFNLDDARLNLKGKISRKEEKSCGGLRVMKASFNDRAEGSPERPELEGTVRDSRFMNIDKVEITVGTMQRTATFHMPGCAHGLKFNPNESVQASDVDVRNNGDGTWTIKTRAKPDNVAVCIPDEDGKSPPPRTYWHMPFEITVTLK